MIEQIHIEKGVPLPPRRLPRSPSSCVFCGKRDRQGGYKTCNQCRADVKSAYENQKAKGMCGWGVNCPNKAAEGHTMCQTHLERSSRQIRELLNGRLAKGLCRRCGDREVWGTKSWCVLCYAQCGVDSHAPRRPLPVAVRKVIRKFWRDDRIAQRRALALHAVSLIRDERVKDVVSLRHGLVDGIDHSLESVGNKYGVTRERVRQIESKAYGLLEQLGVSTAELKKPSDIQRQPANRPKPTLAEAKKNVARYALRDAVKDGRVIRQPCEKCGRTKVNAHHFDYDRPLDVIWLCPPHHAEAHGKTLRTEKKKRYVFPAWLERVDHSHADIYDAPDILATLKRLQLPQYAVQEATGLTHISLRKLIRGEAVEDDALLTMLRYVESLKTKAA